MNLIWFGPFFIFLLRYVGAYRCAELREVRRRLAEVFEAHPGRPVLICANHLTMIDSMLITWLLFDFRILLQHFNRFPWNVPELKNFGGNFLLRLMCYLGKCVYIERGGSALARQLSWSKVLYLNSLGETICVFPEGGRSRSGRVEPEAAVYGVGQLVQQNPQTVVVSVYLRGYHQDSYSFFPKRGERFYVDFRVCSCEALPGRRGQKAITLSIMDQLAGMEGDYFAARQ